MHLDMLWTVDPLRRAYETSYGQVWRMRGFTWAATVNTVALNALIKYHTAFPPTGD